MKKSLYILAITTLMAGATFTSCNTPEQKEEAAKEEVKDAKHDLNEAQKDANVESVKTANEQEWKDFRTETELKIKANEIRIAELRIKMKKPGKVLDPLYAQRIDDLQQRNKDLETRMDNYETKKSDWEKFKLEFKHDMDGLGQALKDFSVDNKK